MVNQNYIDASILLYTNANLPGIFEDADWDDDGTPDYDQDGFGYNKDHPLADNGHLQSFRDAYLDDGTITGNGEKYRMLYQKLIDHVKLQEFISKAVAAESSVHENTNNQMEIVYFDNNTPEFYNDDIAIGVALKGTGDARAILIDNRDKKDSLGNPIVYEIGEGSGIVIASGDVKITGDWEGSLFIGGRAYCTSGSPNARLAVSTNSMIVYSVTSLYFNYQQGGQTKSLGVINVFQGYQNMTVNGATQDNGIDADMISKCVTFTNWNRY
jgi:hypothetical protein